MALIYYWTKETLQGMHIRHVKMNEQDCDNGIDLDFSFQTKEEMEDHISNIKKVSVMDIQCADDLQWNDLEWDEIDPDDEDVKPEEEMNISNEEESN